MKYFKQEDFNKCVEFLKGKSETGQHGGSKRHRNS